MSDQSRNPGSVDPPKYISISEACDRYGIGRTTIHTLIAANQITARKLGARTLIDVKAADDFFNDLPSPAKARACLKTRSSKR